MIKLMAWVKYYSKGIVTAVGMAATLATALGLQHEHYVAIILGVLSTVAVVFTKLGAKPAKAVQAPRGPVKPRL